MHSELVLLAFLTALCNSDRGPLLQRLPKTVRPRQYTLVILTDRSGHTFSGNVTINVEVLQDTDTITLHASKNLAIGDVKLYEDEREIQSFFTKVEEIDFLTVHSSTPLHKNQMLTLHISFSGRTSTEIGAYFRVATDQFKLIKWMSGTAFEMVRAREAFPCWDEPEFKARFLVSLIHTSSHKALGNMPVEHSEPYRMSLDPSSNNNEEDWVIDHFANSPLMSSYLVAFNLHQLSSIEGKTDGGSLLRLWTAQDSLSSAKISLEIAIKSLSWLENYTGMKQPLPKIDMVSVDGFPGALENWGDIAFQESALTGEPQLFFMIAHELAHSWFGNLVTPIFWDSLWLSEGAATFFSALVMEHVKPNLARFEMETFMMIPLTFLSNAAESKSLKADIKYQEDLKIMPDGAYSHGFSMFRMLFYMVGRKQFQSGIQRYVHKHQFSNVAPEDLFKALNYKWKNLPLEELMKEWVVKPYIPVVKAIRSDGKVILSQKTFTFSGSKEDPDDSKWWVPITFTSQSKGNFDNTEPKLWFRENTTLKDPALSSEWLLFNLHAAGLYLVSYDSANLKLIMKALASKKHGGIPATERAKLWLDLTMLCIGNFDDTSCAHLADLFELLVDEHDYGPWVVALQCFTYLEAMIDKVNHDKEYFNDHLKKVFKKSVSSELRNIRSSHSEGKTVLTTELMNNLDGFACEYSLPECLDPNKKMYRVKTYNHHRNFGGYYMRKWLKKL